MSARPSLLPTAMTVAPNGSPEGTYYFTATVELPAGANTVQVAATDLSGAQSQKSYRVTVNPAASPAYTFDGDGNCTGDGTKTYEWDAENRLVAINNGSQRTEFSYDGFGRRVKIVEKNNGVVTSTKRFVWSGTGLCEERNGSGTVTKRFFSEGEQIAGANYYFTRDHLGSVREMTDGTGAIRAEYDYDPYGVQAKVQGDMDADLGYAGYYRHAPSGLDLTLFRAYDPNQGQWLSRDSIGEVGGINLYQYVANNPINFYDPYGLIIWSGVFNATAGIIGNSLGVVGGFALGAGTSWTGVGAVAGGVIAVKSGYGVGANILNLIDALNDRQGSSKGSLLNDLAAS